MRNYSDLALIGFNFNVLPITKILPQVLDCLSSDSNLVLQAEPGAGKSTALPLSLLDAKWLGNKKIVMLEPRRVAAKSIAYYLASQLGEKVGERIGYQIKNDRKVSSNTVLEIVTEGILTRRLQNDPELSDVALIIFDEFHERSIHADLSLMFALEVQQSLRDDLKILVMSATIDTDEISAYLDGAAVIKCPGRQFPVTVDYTSGNNSDFSINKHQLVGKVSGALRTVLARDAAGDVLVFLPGQADIKRCLADAQSSFPEQSNIVFLPLYGALSIEQQEKALVVDPQGKRRVIFTTNIAETSLTIEGVTCVIDSGLEKVVVYDPVSNMTRLETNYISKASAEQRKGRAGRLQEGQCIRLWSESKHNSLPDFQVEEIRSADLTNLLLELAVWGQTDYNDINWLTAPPKSNYDTAKQVLISLGLLNESGKVTDLGNKASKFGLEPRLATMLLSVTEELEQGIACDLAALLSAGDIFYGNRDTDIVERLVALQDYKSDRKAALKSYPIKQATIEQVLVSIRSLKSRLKISTKHSNFTLTQLQQCVGRLLLVAYPERLAKRRSENSGRYLLANGRGVVLHDNDTLFGSEWLVVSDCNAQKKDGFIFTAAAIERSDIDASIGSKIVEENEYQLDDKKQKIIGRKVVKYQAITLESNVLADIPTKDFQKCMHSLLQKEGLKLLNWTNKCEEWLARASWLGEYIDQFPKISKQTLVDDVDNWLLPYISKVKSLAQLKKVNLFELLIGILPWEQQQLLEQEAPVNYITPSNKKVVITYDKSQGPTVSVQLQEMFGELKSPCIGGGKVPLRFELLSPARRPIQTTSDLANFWETSYYDVAKEMRGRYPKHRWPEKPLLEKAGRSIKR